MELLIQDSLTFLVNYLLDLQFIFIKQVPVPQGREDNICFSGIIRGGFRAVHAQWSLGKFCSLGVDRLCVKHPQRRATFVRFFRTSTMMILH